MSFTSSKVSSQPIGVFDSGLGGLTVVKQIRKVLPNESILYFGDIARLPYGIKSKQQIIQFSIQNAEYLMKLGIKVLIIACNSSSSAAYKILKKRLPIPVIDVIEPAVEKAVELTRSARIGVIATQATIDTKAYEKGITRQLPQSEVYSRSCGMFVPMVEEGWLEGAITETIVSRYLEPIKRKNVDVLMLGCTHYPLLEKVLSHYMGPDVRLVNSAEATVQKLVQHLEKSKMKASSRHRGVLKVFVSDKPRNFVSIGEQFLGEKLNYVKVVRENS